LTLPGPCPLEGHTVLLELGTSRGDLRRDGACPCQVLVRRPALPSLPSPSRP
jgi:hypothetical protein